MNLVVMKFSSSFIYDAGFRNRSSIMTENLVHDNDSALGCLKNRTQMISLANSLATSELCASSPFLSVSFSNKILWGGCFFIAKHKHPFLPLLVWAHYVRVCVKPNP